MAATAPSDRGSDTAVSEQLRPGTEDVIGPSKAAADSDDYHGSATNEKGGPTDGHEALAATTSRASTSQYAESRFLRFMTPKRCRWDPSSPPDLPMPLALLYALVSSSVTPRDRKHWSNNDQDKYLHCGQYLLLSANLEHHRRGVRRLVRDVFSVGNLDPGRICFWTYLRSPSW